MQSSCLQTWCERENIFKRGLILEYPTLRVAVKIKQQIQPKK